MPLKILIRILQLLVDSNAYGFVINESRTKELVFGGHRHLILAKPFSTELNNVLFEAVTSCNNLDIVIDIGLRCRSHVCSLLKEPF